MTGPAATTEKATQTDAQPKKGAQTNAQPEKGAQTHAPPVRWYFYVEPEDYDDYYDYRDEDPNDNIVSEGLDYDPEYPKSSTMRPPYETLHIPRTASRNQESTTSSINVMQHTLQASSFFFDTICGCENHMSRIHRPPDFLPQIGFDESDTESDSAAAIAIAASDNDEDFRFELVHKIDHSSEDGNQNTEVDEAEEQVEED
ncbi:hypothetical protein HDU86_005467 [Geranomyces michiganensis]|nr:hypothetical protein HDU86_005467 [Geranomyces michiganensis]